ncbi:DinB family protein [Halpernia sp.]|uniref:DinB family protein n=1 Tax=Halpernia sp. TaxID=2782209 RepID=UPI003A922CA1
MNTLQNLKTELLEEYETTKKFLEVFPEGKNDYAPHKKSMKMMPLATHITEIFAWPEIIFKTEKLDFATGDYKPTFLNKKEELIQKLEQDYNKGKNALENAKDEDLTKRWTMNNGETVLMDFSKYGAIRHALNQITHHRAQLGVYYRLNDIALPGSYGPSADENF